MNPFLVQSYHRLLNGLPFCLFSQLHIVTNQYLLNFGNSYLFQVSARPLKFIITSQCADKDNWSLIPTASVQTRALFISGPMALCLALNFNYVVTGQPLIERPTRTLIGRTSTLLSHFTLRTFLFNRTTVPPPFRFELTVSNTNRNMIILWFTNFCICGRRILRVSPEFQSCIVVELLSPHPRAQGMSLILLIQLLLEALDQASLSLARTV